MLAAINVVSQKEIINISSHRHYIVSKVILEDMQLYLARAKMSQQTTIAWQNERVETYPMSPAVEGDPYSSKSRIRSPNCPCRSPNILIGAFSCNTLGSLANILSALSQRSAISLQSKKNCLRTGGFQPRGFRRWAITWAIIGFDFQKPFLSKQNIRYNYHDFNLIKPIKCETYN